MLIAYFFRINQETEGILSGLFASRCRLSKSFIISLRFTGIVISTFVGESLSVQHCTLSLSTQTIPADLLGMARS